MAAADETRGLSSSDKIVYEAQKRFKQCHEWEAGTRQKQDFDTKFYAGDSYNNYQWPDTILRDRNQSNKPILTVNVVKPHCLNIINDQRQNQSQIEIRPVGNGASYQAAKVFEGIVRHIEYESNAQAVYSNACFGQVVGGIGWCRIVTEYSSPQSFEQSIFLRRVADPNSIYLDPDISEADGSDAKFAFVYKDMPRDEFIDEYGEDNIDNNPLGDGLDDHWETKDHVRVVEYFRKSPIKDKLYLLTDGSKVTESQVREMEKIKANLDKNPEKDHPLRDTFMLHADRDALKRHTVAMREITTDKVEWFLIAGRKILDKNIWPGQYIPLIRFIGEELIIDKTLDRRGHVRCMLDSQRIRNFWTSSAVEQVALQTKSPYITAVEAVSGFENEWADANIVNKAYIPYNGFTETGDAIPKPEREPPPVMSQAYLEGIKISESELMQVSGQYEANLGIKSNEVSGSAVDARQRQGEVSTYHFIDRFSQALCYAGRILVDLVPKIYDTKRIVKILSIDGTPTSVQIDPTHPQAHTQIQNQDDDSFDPEAIMSIMNPQVGEYDVVATIGPNYTTRRQEQFNAISQILKADPAIMPIVGDLLFKSADFDLADEIAQRLYRMVPPQALGQGPPPADAMMQKQIGEQSQLIQKLQSELLIAKNKSDATEQQKFIDQYNAETNRLKVVGAIDPAGMLPIVRTLESQAMGQPINPLAAAHAYENSLMAQSPEAPPSPVPDPNQQSAP